PGAGPAAPGAGGGDRGGGGGGGEEAPSAPEDAPEGGEGDAAGLTRNETDRILSGAERAERSLQREKLRKEPGVPPRGGRDW
ncbi:MAG: hypothetical protein M3P24_12030, partial [Gemmatimonadota bacterium]|nr:hypothetical protein [Gemmatimonadota bacterium]